MILAVSLNPSVDIAYQISGFRTDAVNRTADIRKTPGGKGMNVARVLRDSGEDVTAAGLAGGDTGILFTSLLRKDRIRSAFYPVSGETRNCIAILHDGSQTEILEAGPVISEKEYAGFLRFFRKTLPACRVVVFSGSLPQGLPEDTYARLISVCARHGLPAVLDCSGSALKAALTAKDLPAVIKPNLKELGDLLQKEITADEAQLKEALSSPLFDGVGWVVVSLGKDGCFARHGDTFYKATVPAVRTVSAVGSGDAAVAGIAAGLLRGLCDTDLLKHACTLGTLNAMEAATGCVDMRRYSDIFQKIEVKEV